MKPSAWTALRPGAVAAALLALPSSAYAHAAGRTTGDFYWGFLHPVVALESAVPLVALGLLAGQQGMARARLMLLFTCLGIPAGAFAGQYDPASGLPSLANLACFIILGLLLAAAIRLPASAAAALALLCAFFQGWSNAAEAVGDADLRQFTGGVLFSAFWLFLFSAAVSDSLSRRQGWRPIVVRVAGSWIAAIGLMVIALR